MREAWSFGESALPLVTTAIHAGHDLRPEVAQHTRSTTTPGVARRIPSPTASPCRWAADRRAPIALRGRPQPAAPQRVYEDARRRVGSRGVAGAAHGGAGRALRRLYDEFYADARRLPRRSRRPRPVRRARHALLQPPPRRRRSSAGVPWTNTPEVNVGTGSLDRDRWGHVVDRFIDDLAQQRVAGHRARRPGERPLPGGRALPAGARALPESGCALAIEFKKVFMDEWTGEPDDDHLAQLTGAFAAVGARSCSASSRAAPT